MKSTSVIWHPHQMILADTSLGIPRKFFTNGGKWGLNFVKSIHTVIFWWKTWFHGIIRNGSEISEFSHCELVRLPSETGYCRVIRGLMCWIFGKGDRLPIGMRLISPLRKILLKLFHLKYFTCMALEMIKYGNY